MQKTSADVRVMGLVAGTHVIEDLQTDVPYGVTVTVPAERAYMSKDLWRGISQRCLFHLPSAPPPQLAAVQVEVPVVAPERPLSDLERRLEQLEAENQKLRQMVRPTEVLKGYDAKLDQILASLQNGHTSVAPVASSQPVTVREVKTAKPVEEEVADGTAPQFIPSEIVPRDAQTYIDVQGKSSTGDAVSEAAARLRKMRKR